MTGHVCPPDHKHAKNGTCYSHHKCRCDACRERARRYARFTVIRKEKLGTQVIPARGTLRRLQALQAIGWTLQAIGEKCGMTLTTVSKLADPAHDRVTRRTAERIDRAYREMALTPGPSDRGRGLSAKKGYIPPIAWNDIDRDEAPEFRTDAAIVAEFQARKQAGETTKELGGLVVELVENGHSQNEAGRLLGLSPNAVSRVINIETKEAA